jgi:hypothetical protein
MDDHNIDAFVSEGVKLGIFIEQIPFSNKKPDSCLPDVPGSVCLGDRVDAMTQDETSIMLSQDERSQFRKAMLHYREEKPLFIIHAPGDEEFFGGCASAGRGFVHVTPSGDLTACPVSNLATHNLTRSRLRDALASPLLVKIRESENLLSGDTSCALSEHPEELDVLAKEVGAYYTDKEPDGQSPTNFGLRSRILKGICKVRERKLPSRAVLH